MIIDDFLIESRGYDAWNKVIHGVSFDRSPLNDEEIKLIRKKVAEELDFIRREFCLEACSKNHFSLSQAYSDFSRAAYESLTEFCINPKEVLNDLPKRVKTPYESSLEKAVSNVKIVQNTITAPIVVLGAVGSGILENTTVSGYSPSSLNTAAFAAVGAAITYLASKSLFESALNYLGDRLNLEKISADCIFTKNINKYINQNISFAHSQPL